MNSLYEHYPVAIWIIAGIIWTMGLICWIVTYIGAPIESKKSGHHVSGIPGVAFVLFLAAGVISPYKWLMLTALLDFSVTYLPIFLLKEHISKSRKHRKEEKK